MPDTSKSGSSSLDETTQLLPAGHAINNDLRDIEKQIITQIYRSPHRPHRLIDRPFYALNPIDGKTPVIKTAEGKIQLRRVENDTQLAKVLDYFAFRVAAPMGAAYSFYTIAQTMELMPVGMLLLIPVLSAPVAIGSINIVDLIAKFYGLEENTRFRSLLKKVLMGIEKSVEVQTEIGGLFTTVALFNDALTNSPMASNDISRFLLPAVAVAGGTATSIAKWIATTPDRMSVLVRTLTIGITDPVLLNTVLGLLLQQLPPEEQAYYIPILAASLGGMLVTNMASEIYRESYPGVAKIKDFGFEMIKYIMLELFVFGFANDMYAANNNDNVPPSYFYTNVGLSSVLLFAILFRVGQTLFSDYEYDVELDEQAAIITDDSDDEEPPALEEQYDTAPTAASTTTSVHSSSAKSSSHSSMPEDLESSVENEPVPIEAISDLSSTDQSEPPSTESINAELTEKTSSNNSSFSENALVDTMFSRPRSQSLTIPNVPAPSLESTTMSL